MFNLPIPKNAPIAAGEIIEEEYRKPLGLTQLQLAKALGISRVRYAEIASGKRGITIDTAFRLGRVLDTSPQLWLNIQLMHDMWYMQNSAAASEIRKLKPLKMKMRCYKTAIRGLRGFLSVDCGRRASIMRAALPRD